MYEISAYIPCFNNEATITRVIQSIQLQTYPVKELFLINDGSTDRSADIAKEMGVSVISQPSNLGRGAARARAMEEAKYELVLCCDATKTLDCNFVKNALCWFEEERVAAVFGALTQASPITVTERWRGRHLFPHFYSYSSVRSSFFPTFGALVRKSSVLEVGNFNNLLRHNEDAELGQRLLASGYDVISDSNLTIIDINNDSLARILERYWRWNKWNGGKGHKLNGKTYCEWILHSILHMAAKDLQAGDLMSIPISLFSPHYRFWRSWWEKDRFLNE